MPTIASRARRRLMRQLIANTIAQAALLFTSALIIRHAFDQLMNDLAPPPHRLLLIGLVMTLLAVVTGWLQRSERIIAEKLGQSYVHSLRLRLFRHITRMDHRELQKKRQGAVMLKFVGDLNAVRRWVSLGLVRLIVSGGILFSALSVLGLIDPILSLSVAVIILIAVLVNVRIGEALKAAVSLTRRRRSQLSANINEKIDHMAVVQVFGRSAQEIRQVRRQSNRLRKALIDRAARIGSIRAITHGGAAMALALVLTIGLMQVAAGQTTPGTVAAAIGVLGFLLPALKNLGRVYEYFQDFRVSKMKLDLFLATRAPLRPRSGLPNLPSGPGRITFKKVAVKGVIRSLSAEIEPGRNVALVGPNGSGKSTLIGLTARLVQTDKGRILIDGQNIRRVNLHSLHRAVGVVAPDLPLLAGSLEKNLRYRYPDCPSEELERVFRLCGLDDLVKFRRIGRFRIQEGGRNLSAGQRQRVMLARAIMGSPRILLLDEVDAHLDRVSCATVDNVIRSYQGTVLWVTHRSDVSTIADATWRMAAGRLLRKENSPRVLKMAG
jgi:ABC-type multidrug transport system fused ATPase/permease subunit